MDKLTLSPPWLVTPLNSKPIISVASENTVIIYTLDSAHQNYVAAFLWIVATQPSLKCCSPTESIRIQGYKNGSTT